MNKEIFSQELVSVFKYVKDTILAEYPKVAFNEYAFILSVLNNEDSAAYKSLSLVAMDSTLEKMREYFTTQLTYIPNGENEDNPSYLVFESYFKDCRKSFEYFGVNEITSSILLLCIMRKNEAIAKKIKSFSVTTTQLLNAIKDHKEDTGTEIVKAVKKTATKKKKTEKTTTQPIKVIDVTGYENDTDFEKSTVNINKLSADGEIPTVIGYDKYYDEIFTILSKKDKNNVVVSGKWGVGKTAVVKNIANLINERKCNPLFFNKTLVEVDFSKMVAGTPFKGAFEQKFYNILNMAKRNANFIFFFDDLQFLMGGNAKYAETDVESLLKAIMDEPRIMTISTITPKGLYMLQTKTCLGKYVQEVTIDEPDIEQAKEIVSKCKWEYETYHDVKFDDDAVATCVELCKRYMTKRALPDSALDLLDSIGAKANLKTEDNPDLEKLKKRLSELIDETNTLKESSDPKVYDEIDDLIKQQISLKTQINSMEKEKILSKETVTVTKNDVCAFISKRVDIPLEDLTKTEKTRLKGLGERIKEKVIGQDEAVDEVCRVVKRQRVGLGESERPAVLMFLGNTGTGKTYLAKQLAKEVFGDEKYFVRMDMSEYADKTSVNKISGSNPGYVGYEDETYILKALKQKKRFVLLLDEFEKSDEEVHNLFLQMFDEGRYTDNHGQEYSLKDVIIIMTSNVGAAEAANRGKSIGFGETGYDLSREIVEKELRKKFKPEFLNRIQKIVYFNRLDDNNLKSIVEMEIKKLDDKVEKLGYHLSEDITKTSMVDDIFNFVLTKKEYGARPIVNEVQRRIEDNIVDYIIENEVEDGHTFTYQEING